MSSVNKGIIAKKVNGQVSQIYPKTSADMVVCENNESVEAKLQSIETANALFSIHDSSAPIYCLFAIIFLVLELIE